MAKKKIQGLSASQVREIAAELADIGKGLEVLSLESVTRARTRLASFTADLGKTADSLESSDAAAADAAAEPEGPSESA